MEKNKAQQTQAPQDGVFRKYWRNIAILLVIIAAFALAYFLVPSFRNGLKRGLSAMTSGELAIAVSRFQEYIRSFGVWAPIVSAGLMVIQSILFPVPGQIVTIANGLLFGAFWGFWLSWASAMLGAITCFFIARALGRPTVEKLASKKALTVADQFFDRYGNNSILVSRLIPLVSFDAVSYLAGVTSVSFRGFIIATAIGQVPMTIVYSIFGQNLTGMVSYGIYAVLIILALVIAGLTLKKVFEKRIASRQAKQARCKP